MVLTKVFRFTAVAGLLLGASACTGAGGAPSSSTSPPSASASSSSASPTPTAAYKPADANGPAENVPKPEKPALADEFSEQGLDAFTRYWYAAYNYLVETGDPNLLQSVTQQSCARCNNVIADTSAWYNGGGWRIGDLLTPTSIRVTFTSVYQALVQYNKSDGTFIRPDGQVEKNYPATVADVDVFNATYLENKWLVSNVGKAG